MIETKKVPKKNYAEYKQWIEYRFYNDAAQILANDNNMLIIFDDEFEEYFNCNTLVWGKSFRHLIDLEYFLEKASTKVVGAFGAV